jgi:hypothetical protein
MSQTAPPDTVSLDTLPTAPPLRLLGTPDSPSPRAAAVVSSCSSTQGGMSKKAFTKKHRQRRLGEPAEVGKNAGWTECHTVHGCGAQGEESSPGRGQAMFAMKCLIQHSHLKDKGRKGGSGMRCGLRSGVCRRKNSGRGGRGAQGLLGRGLAAPRVRVRVWVCVGGWRFCNISKRIVPQGNWVLIVFHGADFGVFRYQQPTRGS